MAEQPRDHGLLQLSGAALDEWASTLEHIMRGVAHTLNNRAAALSAVIELSRDAEKEDRVAIDSILRSELLRVGELASALRTLGPPRIGDAEAFAPADAAAESITVLQLHAEQRDRTVTIDASAAPPIRAHRWMFVRAIVALAVAATARAASQRPLGVSIVGEGEWVVTRVDGLAQRTEELSPYAVELTRALGGETLTRGCGFRVPTLAALRMREGR